MKNFSSLPLVKYFSQVQEELQKVTWPTRRQTQTKTLVVIAVSIVVGLYIGGLDLLFTQLTQLLLR